MEEVERHLMQVALLSDVEIVRHLRSAHGFADTWPFLTSDELITKHRRHHVMTDTPVRTDQTQVVGDTVKSDGPTEDEVTVTVSERSVAELQAEVSRLEERLAEAERRAEANLLQVPPSYRDRVKGEVQRYLDEGDLCVEEAQRLNTELDLGMMFGWQVYGTVEFHLNNVAEELDCGPLMREIEDAVRSILEDHAEATSAGFDWRDLDASVSCEQQDD